VRGKRINKINENIINWVEATLTGPMTVEPLGKGVFNYQCHSNCVAEALEDSDNTEIIQVICKQSSHVYLHYIIFRGGKYLDPSIGWLVNHTRYFYLKTLGKDDWESIHHDFEQSQDHYFHKFTNWFDRNFLKIDRVL